jgi:hypothetical protein
MGIRFSDSPEDVYLETNMFYVVSTEPTTYAQPVIRIGLLDTDEAREALDSSKVAK